MSDKPGSNGAKVITGLFAALTAAATTVPQFAMAQGSNDYPSLMVKAAVVGAADGMVQQGWHNAGIEARVDAIRDQIPTSRDDTTHGAHSPGMRVVLFDIRYSSYHDALDGYWTEDALEGYLDAAEISEKSYEKLSYAYVRAIGDARSEKVISQQIGEMFFPKMTAKDSSARHAASMMVVVSGNLLAIDLDYKDAINREPEAEKELLGVAAMVRNDPSQLRAAADMAGLFDLPFGVREAVRDLDPASGM